MKYYLLSSYQGYLLIDKKKSRSECTVTVRLFYDRPYTPLS
jgi:hypothetical protein